ncbi:hypothetical protein [Kitasatospora sp. NPDC094011]|uniref:hypothetical protein n=1 Tax=Kitasatospora sp. NPDC094011 TaxID=3364090 RepID=UPI0037FFB59E
MLIVIPSPFTGRLLLISGDCRVDSSNSEGQEHGNFSNECIPLKQVDVTAAARNGPPTAPTTGNHAAGYGRLLGGLSSPRPAGNHLDSAGTRAGRWLVGHDRTVPQPRPVLP